MSKDRRRKARKPQLSDKEKEAFIGGAVVSDMANSQVVNQVIREYMTEKSKKELIESKLREVKMERDMWKGKCEELTKRNEKLETMMSTRIEGLEGEMKVLRKQLQEKTEEILKLHSVIKQKDLSLDGLKSEVNSLKIERDTEKTRITKLETNMETMQKQMSTVLQCMLGDRKKSDK